MTIYYYEARKRKTHAGLGGNAILRFSSGKLGVYHSTDADFTKFDRARLGENTDLNAGDESARRMARLGFWFNEKNLREKLYQNRAIAAYANVNNPYETTFDQLWDILSETSHEEFIDGLKKDGYDGIILEDTEFGGKSFVMFDPEQIKSADPVTYDDNGNVIPLSQRFNHRNSDVRFSISPNLRADVEEALRKGTGPDSKQKKRHENVIFSEAPAIFRFVGIPDLPVVSDVTRIRKMSIKHSLTSDQIADLPNRYQSPVAVMRDGNGYVILTDMMATSQHRELKPVRMVVRPVTWKTGERILLATALSENAVDEKEYYEPRIKGGLLYADKTKSPDLRSRKRPSQSYALKHPAILY